MHSLCTSVSKMLERGCGKPSRDPPGILPKGRTCGQIVQRFSFRPACPLVSFGPRTIPPQNRHDAGKLLGARPVVMLAHVHRRGVPQQARNVRKIDAACSTQARQVLSSHPISFCAWSRTSGGASRFRVGRECVPLDAAPGRSLCHAGFLPAQEEPGAIPWFFGFSLMCCAISSLRPP